MKSKRSSMPSGRLEDAARGLLSAAILGSDWISALEPIMAEMNVFGGGPSRVAPPKLFAIPTNGARTLFADFKAGVCPPLTGDVVIPAAASDGFIADYMSPTHAARKRDPFYNEFLRPRRACHQAVAFLDETDVGCVRLLVFREERQGVFEASELSGFSRILPYLRSAAMVAGASFDNAARRQAEPFDQRGEPVFFLGPDGRIIEANAAAENAVREVLPIVNGRLATRWPAEQARLDRAVTAALVDERPALAMVRAEGNDAPIMALVVPVSGDANDVFRKTSAIVVLIDRRRRRKSEDAAVDLLKDAADLTPRETALVRLMGTGRSPGDVAAELGIGYSTARSHLKASFSKLGVHTQSELVALIHRLV